MNENKMKYEYDDMEKRLILDREYIFEAIQTLQLDSEKLTVLDLGCGRGKLCDILNKENKWKMIIGVDSNKKAIEDAKRKYEDKNIKFINTNAVKMPLEDHSVDLVIARMFFCMITEREMKLILIELKRILKTNGHIIVYSNFNGDIKIEKNIENLYLIEKANLRFKHMSNSYNDAKLIGEAAKLFNCKIKMVWKDSLHPGNKALIDYYCLTKNEIDFLNENLLVKTKMIDVKTILEFDKCLRNYLECENYAFAQQLIIFLQCNGGLANEVVKI